MNNGKLLEGYTLDELDGILLECGLLRESLPEGLAVTGINDRWFVSDTRVRRNDEAQFDIRPLGYTEDNKVYVVCPYCRRIHKHTIPEGQTEPLGYRHNHCEGFNLGFESYYIDTLNENNGSKW